MEYIFFLLNFIVGKKCILQEEDVMKIDNLKKSREGRINEDDFIILKKAAGADVQFHREL